MHLAKNNFNPLLHVSNKVYISHDRNLKSLLTLICRDNKYKLIISIGKKNDVVLKTARLE